jgi:prepilin-type N-terminal cleavage/methylation domain-containing protein
MDADRLKKEAGGGESVLLAGQAGFSLIEVLIAMAIFAIGILGVFSMQIGAINGNSTARKVTENITWATDKAEELHRLPYNDDRLRAGTHPDDFGDFDQESDGIDNNWNGEIDEVGETGPIRISWTVRDDTPRADLKTIVLSVTQTQALGNDRNIRLNFIKGNF